MREQSRQVDQERWRLSQEESRLKALQGALEDERRVTMEQLSSQRAEVRLGEDWDKTYRKMRLNFTLQAMVTFLLYDQITNSPFVFPYISYRSNGEKLLKYQ